MDYKPHSSLTNNTHRLPLFLRGKHIKDQRNVFVKLAFNALFAELT